MGKGSFPGAATWHLLISPWPELRHMATPGTVRYPGSVESVMAGHVPRETLSYCGRRGEWIGRDSKQLSRCV